MESTSVNVKNSYELHFSDMFEIVEYIFVGLSIFFICGEFFKRTMLLPVAF